MSSGRGYSGGSYSSRYPDAYDDAPPLGQYCYVRELDKRDVPGRLARDAPLRRATAHFLAGSGSIGREAQIAAVQEARKRLPMRIQSPLDNQSARVRSQPEHR
jgi:hypothetical protein